MFKPMVSVVLVIISANIALALPGSGTEADPWRIESFSDFNEFCADANYWDGYTRLEADVNLAGVTYGMAVIAPHSNRYSYDYDSAAFTGVFEGNGHKITGMTIDDVGSVNNYLGLFGCNRGEVRNLALEDATIVSAGLVRYAGGLAAWNAGEGSISNCSSIVDVNAIYAVGGLCGFNEGDITGCFAGGSVKGGMGYNHANKIGGLVGMNTGLVSDCYSSSNVNCLMDATDVGGLVGHNSEGTIRNCYSTGSVSGGAEKGGLCGKHSVAGAILHSFWNSETAGCLYSAGGWAVGTVEMKTESTYIGWNNGAWVLDEGADYPRLLWEGTAGDIIDYEYPRTYPGDGVSQAFEIGSSEDMVCMSRRPSDWDKGFILTGDIDMSLVVDYRPPSMFKGFFDGNDYAIENLTIVAVIIGNNYHLGVFGKMGVGSDVLNLGVKNVNILGGPYCRYVGGLCGENDSGRIRNCYTTGTVTGGQYSDDLGGLCGDNEEGEITDSYSRAVVSSGAGSHDLGGLCGKNEGVIADCNASGAVSGNMSFEVGGLCGENDEEGVINNCYSTGSVSGGGRVGGLAGDNAGKVSGCNSSGDVRGDWLVGGLAGANDGRGGIWNCYSTGDVDGVQNVGGLVGANDRGILSNCYSASDVTGLYTVGGLVGENDETIVSNCYSRGDVAGEDGAGGLVGYNNAGTIRKCYSFGAVSGNSQVGGLCGRHRTAGAVIDSFWNKDTAGVPYSAGGWAMSTAQMQIESTYSGWNDGSWIIDEGVDYPHLVWEGTVGDVMDYEYPRSYPGDGAEHAFELDSAEDMVSMSLRSSDWGKRFILTSDIDMSSVIGYRQPGLFTGRFDGQGHSLEKLTINANVTGNNYHLGAFGKIAEGAQVADLGVEDVNIIGGDNCRFLGGLCGKNEGFIIACFTTGSVSGGDNSDDLGGICGDNEDGAIVQSFSSVSVSSGDGSNDLGGLCGKNKGLITKCYATGAVLGGASTEEVGGFCGENDSPGSISKCYSTGPVSGSDDVGGFCGDEEGGLMRDCFWDVETSGLYASDGGTGRSTQQMQDIATYVSAGWDFMGESANGTSETWRMPEDGYPLLGFFDSPVPYPLAGSGTSGDPYLISDANELGMINWYFADCSFALTADVNLSGITWGTPVAPVFGGGFDGDGHKVSDMMIVGDGTLGMFGHLSQSGRVSNLGIDGCSVLGTGYRVGALVGRNAGGSVSSCYSFGGVIGGFEVGGLVGYNDQGGVSNCSSVCAVNGENYVGGLIGRNAGSNVSNCYSAGSIFGTSTIGGLLGRNDQGSVSNCYSTASVTGSFDCAGLVGYNNQSTISNCYSTGDASGEWSIGGLVAYNREGSLFNCYSTGDVWGNDICGGLVGRNSEGDLQDSFWDIQTQSHGVTESIGDNFGTFTNVGGLPTANMQMANTFTSAGWDFVGEAGNGADDIWAIHDGADYPDFVWKRVNLVGWCEVDSLDFAFFADRWMNADCGDNDDCDGADFDFSGAVDGEDLRIFSDHWLDGAAL